MIRKLLGILVVVACLIGACTDYDVDAPDTPANQRGFERHFGFAVPASVSELYYYADELGADVAYQLSFKADQQTIEKIAAELGLAQAALDFGVELAREVDWWDEDAIKNLTPYWKRNAAKDYYWVLWYDPLDQRAYYLEFSL